MSKSKKYLLDDKILYFVLWSFCKTGTKWLDFPPSCNVPFTVKKVLWHDVCYQIRDQINVRCFMQQVTKMNGICFGCGPGKCVRTCLCLLLSLLQAAYFEFYAVLTLIFEFCVPWFQQNIVSALSRKPTCFLLLILKILILFVDCPFQQYTASNVLAESFGGFSATCIYVV